MSGSTSTFSQNTDEDIFDSPIVLDTDSETISIAAATGGSSVATTGGQTVTTAPSTTTTTSPTATTVTPTTTSVTVTPTAAGDEVVIVSRPVEGGSATGGQTPAGGGDTGGTTGGDSASAGGDAASGSSDTGASAGGGAGPSTDENTASSGGDQTGGTTGGDATSAGGGDASGGVGTPAIESVSGGSGEPSTATGGGSAGPSGTGGTIGSGGGDITSIGGPATATVGTPPPIGGAATPVGGATATSGVFAALPTDPRELQVFRLYDTAFDRAPDAAGLAFWTAALRSGTTLDAVADAVVASAEFQGTTRGLDANSFVNLLYQNSFERDADPAGRAGWTGALQRGALQRDDVVLAFSESPEHLATTLRYDDPLI